MAAHPRQLTQHDPHPLRHGRNFQLQQFFDSQRITKIIAQVRKVIHPVGERNALLIFLDFEFFFNARVKKSDFGPRGQNRFAVQL